MPKKLLPVSVTNFKELRSALPAGLTYAYADKTGLIAEVISSPKSLLITRPIRFMKSANLSLLQHFFEIRDREAPE